MRESESPAPPRFESILLASEGRPISEAAIKRVTELAASSRASVHVFSIARVHGVSFGMPNPGLLPTRAEWKQQHDIVAKAVKRLRRQGLKADGQVVGTRKSTKRILQEAADTNSEAIVMSADRDRHVLIRDMLWSQEPQRIRRRAKLPVYLVVDSQAG